MLVDASALFAMLTDEAKARLLAGRLQNAANRMVLPTAVVETVALVAATTGLDAERANALVARFLDLMGIRTVSVPASLAVAAASAMERFGATAERPDGLTAQDCLAYAAARYYRQPLLFDGSRFALTDIEAG